MHVYYVYVVLHSTFINLHAYSWARTSNSMLICLVFTADKAVSLEQASCYRFILPGSCSHPLAQKITKQICCCSRVGKAWGAACERCPLPDTGMSLSRVSVHYLLLFTLYHVHLFSFVKHVILNIPNKHPFSCSWFYLQSPKKNYVHRVCANEVIYGRHHRRVTMGVQENELWTV